MPKQAKQYTLMYIPESGLFHDGIRFLDGEGIEVPWGHRSIPVYPSRRAAEAARDKLIKCRGTRCERYVIVGYTPYIPNERGK